MFFEFSGLMGQTFQIAQPMMNLGEAVVQGTEAATVGLTSISHVRGETNRYTKSHAQRVITQLPEIVRPPIFAAFEYDKYRYSKLTSDRSIRLLKLHSPGTGTLNSTTDDLISCELEEVALADNPKYEALSYSWGIFPRDFPVVVMPSTVQTGKPTALSTNPSLYSALKRLRHPTQTRTLWVDQLCINQEDDDEKSKQVLLMADIFKDAQRTVVWLGEEDGDNKVLSEMVGLFASRSSKSGTQDANFVRMMLDLGYTEDSPNDLTRRQWRHQALVRLLNRSWFSRAWIFQEVVMPTQVLLMCGALEMSLENLMRLSNAVFLVEEEEQGYAHSLTTSTTGFDTLYLIKHSRPGGCGDAECERRNFKPGFLGLLMQALQKLEATVPQDLIYAFLAFKDDITIIPNYKAPVSLVWTEAAKNIIIATKSLDIFSAVRGDEPCSVALPSWVPDWSKCYPYARPICAPDFKSDFKACNALLGDQSHVLETACPHVWEDASGVGSDALIVTGKVIGTISWFSPFSFEKAYYREGLNAVFTLNEHVRVLKRHLVGPSSRHLLQDTDERVMRTMLADGAFGHKQPLVVSPQKIIQICNEEKEIETELRKVGAGPLSEEMEQKKEILDRCRQWSLVVQQKKLFLCEGSEEGGLDLGLAPKAVKKGDLVCLLLGSKAPCVLRSSDEGSGRYRVIGQCYLDEWMYGSPPPGRNWSSSGEQKFVLV
jgi:Heterokaryon incompatibility protein (HET)